MKHRVEWNLRGWSFNDSEMFCTTLWSDLGLETIEHVGKVLHAFQKTLIEAVRCVEEESE